MLAFYASRRRARENNRSHEKAAGCRRTHGLTADVWVPDFRFELHYGRLEGVHVWNLDVDLVGAASIWCTRGSRKSPLQVEEVGLAERRGKDARIVLVLLNVIQLLEDTALFGARHDGLLVVLGMCLWFVTSVCRRMLLCVSVSLPYKRQRPGWETKAMSRIEAMFVPTCQVRDASNLPDLIGSAFPKQQEASGQVVSTPAGSVVIHTTVFWPVLKAPNS